MPVDDKLKNLHGPSRRHFLKWATTMGALLGLERARFLDALSGTAGTALAQTASCASTMRSVHLVAGNGGLAWFQLIWPHVEVAMPPGGVNAANFAFHSPGNAVLAAGTDRPFAYAPETPWRNLGKNKQITAIMSGNNETHDPRGVSTQEIATGVRMISALAAIQSTTPTLLPVIGVGQAGDPALYGAAAGSPGITRAGDANGVVELFNSTASRTLLQAPKNSQLAEAYYKAFLSLNAAAGNPVMGRAFQSGKVAVNLLGRNLATALRATPEDMARYGIPNENAARNALKDIARGLIVTAKAFRLGLTSSVVMPAFLDDPHGAFGGGTTAPTRDVALLGKILDSFMADCAGAPDPSCAAKSLADTIVMTVHGDTPKNPRDRNGWPDGTPGNSNWMYVLGNGYLKTGWFGGIRADGTVLGFDPANPAPNATIAGKASNTHTNAAAAAVAYAVAKGDMRRVSDFYRGGPIDALIVPQNL